MTKGFIEVTRKVARPHRGETLRPVTINTDHIIFFTDFHVTIAGVGDISVEESYDKLHALVQEARTAGRPRKTTKSG